MVVVSDSTNKFTPSLVGDTPLRITSSPIISNSSYLFSSLTTSFSLSLSRPQVILPHVEMIKVFGISIMKYIYLPFALE